MGVVSTPDAFRDIGGAHEIIPSSLSVLGLYFCENHTRDIASLYVFPKGKVRRITNYKFLNETSEKVNLAKINILSSVIY